MATLEHKEMPETEGGEGGVRRRDFINIAAVSFAGVGAVAVVLPLINQMNPSADVLAQATTAALEVPGLRVIGTAADKAAVLSFTIEGIHPHDLGTILDSEGVAIRTGHHCAMPVMEFFGVPATARASFACYNDDEDIARLVGAQVVVGAREARRGRAGAQLRDCEGLFVVGSEVQDPRDVRVAQRGQHLGRAAEADHVVVARRSVAQDLDGDLAVEGVVVGGVDDAHRAGAEVVEDGEAADLRADLRGGQRLGQREVLLGALGDRRGEHDGALGRVDAGGQSGAGARDRGLGRARDQIRMWANVGHWHRC